MCALSFSVFATLLLMATNSKPIKNTITCRQGVDFFFPKVLSMRSRHGRYRRLVQKSFPRRIVRQTLMTQALAMERLRRCL
jgi:hypothetical protein